MMIPHGGLLGSIDAGGDTEGVEVPASSLSGTAENGSLICSTVSRSLGERVENGQTAGYSAVQIPLRIRGATSRRPIIVLAS